MDMSDRQVIRKTCPKLTIRSKPILFQLLVMTYAKTKRKPPSLDGNKERCLICSIPINQDTELWYSCLYMT